MSSGPAFRLFSMMSEPLRCRIGGLAADASTLDLLARLQLAARRLGLELVLQGASGDLRRLLELAGLSGTLRLEPQGQAEERKEVRGVEEERQLDDPAV
jgi:hypothetical protein